MKRNTLIIILNLIFILTLACCSHQNSIVEKWKENDVFTGEQQEINENFENDLPVEAMILIKMLDPDIFDN